MGTYYKINNEGRIEDTILAEKDFIESQPDKQKYVRLITNQEEKFNSEFDFSYALNEPKTVYKPNKEKQELVILNDNIYNFEKRKFKNPQPYASWTFDEESYEWIPPVPKPKKEIVWNEEKQEWVEIEVK
jgi:hypothetical protein